MRQLQLEGDGNDPGRVLALMHFPRDGEGERQFYVRHIVKQACDSGAADAEVRLPAKLLRELIDGPGYLEMRDKVTESTKRGSVAGDLLHLIYEMHALDFQEPSLRKALAEYKKFSLGRKYGDGSPLKYSERMMRDYWNEYEPVAHLWAAFRLNRGPYAYVADAADVFGSADAFRTFLGVAKAIGEFASTFVPKRTRPAKPVLPPDELVHIPAEIPSIRLAFPTA